MLAILWFLLVIIGVIFAGNWLFENNGEVLVELLGYRIETDVLTALLASFILVFLLSFLCYFVARIVSLRFPNIFKALFKKTYIKRLELIVKRQNKGFEDLAKVLDLIDLGEFSAAKKKRKNLLKNKKINDYLDRKMSVFVEDSALKKLAKKVGFFKKDEVKK